MNWLPIFNCSDNEGDGQEDLWLELRALVFNRGVEAASWTQVIFSFYAQSICCTGAT